MWFRGGSSANLRAMSHHFSQKLNALASLTRGRQTPGLIITTLVVREESTHRRGFTTPRLC
jgi:hypothetical protein